MNKTLPYLLLFILIIQYYCEECNSQSAESGIKTEAECKVFSVTSGKPVKCVPKDGGGCEEKAIKCNEVTNNEIKSTFNCEEFELEDNESTDFKCISKQDGVGCEERNIWSKGIPNEDHSCDDFIVSDSYHKCESDGNSGCTENYKNCNEMVDDTTLTTNENVKILFWL